MNTLALKRNSLNFYNLNLKITQLIAGLFFLCACSTAGPQSPRKSTIDTQFQIFRLKNSSASAPASNSVRFYQSVLQTTLGSHCDYMPSDSSYALLVSKKCNPLKTTLKSYSRFSREFDAAYLGLPTVKDHDKIYFADVEIDCDQNLSL